MDIVVCNIVKIGYHLTVTCQKALILFSVGAVIVNGYFWNKIAQSYSTQGLFNMNRVKDQ